MLSRLFASRPGVRSVHRSTAARSGVLNLEPLEAREVPVIAYGLTDNNSLLRFDTAAPNAIIAATPVTGLAAGDKLWDIDFRPRTGQLIGLAVNGTTTTLYSITPLTGEATALGSATVTGITGATTFGIDFNPTVDRLRVVTNLASDGAGGNTNNFRLNPNTGALVAIDTDLNFTALPNGSVNGPEVAVAYSNNFDGATTTVLRGITSGGDLLVVNGGTGPGFSALASVGALGADTGTSAGFDVTTGADGTETGYATLSVGGAPRLYTVNLTTGAATLVGTVGNGTTAVIGFTVAPAGTLVVGSGIGATGDVRILDPITGAVRGTPITPFVNFRGGVRVAAGDINGDGVPDVIVGAEAPNGHIKAFDGVTGKEIRSFFAFFGFNGTVNVTVGDVNGDGFGDIIVSANGVAGGHVKVFDGKNAAVNQDGTPTNTLASFYAYPGPSGTNRDGFPGDIAVAAADFNSDGKDELVTVASTYGHVKTFSIGTNEATAFLNGPGGALFSSFFAFPPIGGASTSGTAAFTVAAGDVNGDGTPDVVLGAASGPGFVRAISGRGTTIEVANFFAFDPGFTGGGSVGLADVNGDGLLDILVTPGAPAPAQVFTFRPNGTQLTAPILTFTGFLGGSSVSGARV